MFNEYGYKTLPYFSIPSLANSLGIPAPNLPLSLSPHVGLLPSIITNPNPPLSTNSNFNGDTIVHVGGKGIPTKNEKKQTQKIPAQSNTTTNQRTTKFQIKSQTSTQNQPSTSQSTQTTPSQSTPISFHPTQITVYNIPSEDLNIEKLNSHFKKFGSIVNIQVNILLNFFFYLFKKYLLLINLKGKN